MINSRYILNSCGRIVWSMSVVICYLVIWAAATDAHAQRNSRYQPGDWVSYGMTRYVTSVATSQDYVYFGSTAGIMRYDIVGRNWKTPYTTSDGLAGNRILVVAHDRYTNTLWCATDKGVSRQHPASLRWSNFSLAEIGANLGDHITSIGFDERSVWFESRSKRMFRLDKFGNIFTSAANDRESDFSAIQWFGAREPKPARLPQFFMPDGYLFDPAGAVQDDHLRSASITDVTTDDWGNMWLGTWGLGVLRGDLTSERAQPLKFGLANERVDALLFTDDGLWIGGLRTSLEMPFDETVRGITHWADPSATGNGDYDWTYFDARYDFNISSDEVNSFVESQGKLYCATEYGISVYDTRKDRWWRIVPEDGLSDERINDVLVYEGYLYAATDLGVNRIAIESVDKDSLDIGEVAPAELRHVAIHDMELQKNLLWIATDRGPFIYNIAEAKGGYLADNQGPRDETTLAMSFADTVIWLGTSYGIEAFDVENKQWFGAPARYRITSGTINCIVADAEALWVGTNAGAFKFHRKRQEWTQYTIEDGLLHNHVNAMVLDDDFIWFGTDVGMTAFRWRAFHDFE